MRSVTAAFALAFGLAPAAAQETFPSRSITMIVPFAAGGTSDVIARLISEQMSQVLGQRIINENVAGAGGATGLTRAARAKPDGYTIAIGNVGTNAASYSIYPDLQYTPASFAPVGLIAKTMPAIALKKDFPAADARAFLAFAKANPNKVTLGHAGVGSSNYIICKQFLAATKIDVTLVSYRGAGPALNDLMGGHLDGVCDTATSLAGSIGGGNVKGLVVASAQRLPTLPNVPTSVEAGIPDFQGEGWNALFVPKDTPAPVIARLNEGLRKASEEPAYRKRLSELSAVIASGEEFDPAYVAALVPREVDKYRKLLSE
jgi:tripartite-type tricarboxylate transporter receptor subunit TctC